MDHLPCERMTITRWLKPRFELGERVVDIDATVANNKKDINRFIKAQGLKGQLNTFNTTHGMHYGIYSEGKLTAYLCLSVGELNRSPFNIVVSVDWLASVDPYHGASSMIAKLKTIIEAKQKSYVFVQSADTQEALDFWAGRFSSSKWSCVFTGLFHIADERYKLYSDVKCFGIGSFSGF